MVNDIIPMYLQIAETIKNRIKFGYYKVEEIINPNDLILEFDNSEITIRKALGRLSNEGWVDRKRGVGTIVKIPENARFEIHIGGDFQDWFDSASGKYPKNLSVEILDIEIVDCSEKIKNILDISLEEQVWRMRRLRKFNKEVYSYFINYGLPSFFESIKPQTYKNRTVFEVIKDGCVGYVNKIEQRVEAVTAAIDLAKILDIPFGSPLFYCENIYFCDDIPIEYTQMYYRSDKYIYHNTIRP